MKNKSTLRIQKEKFSQINRKFLEIVAAQGFGEITE